MQWTRLFNVLISLNTEVGLRVVRCHGQAWYNMAENVLLPQTWKIAITKGLVTSFVDRQKTLQVHETPPFCSKLCLNANQRAISKLKLLLTSSDRGWLAIAHASGSVLIQTRIQIVFLVNSTLVKYFARAIHTFLQQRNSEILGKLKRVSLKTCLIF